MEQYSERYQNFLKCSTSEIRTSKPKKNYVVKHIESDYPRQRYQADTMYLADYISNNTRYLLTMDDHFTKFGLAILIKNKRQILSWMLSNQKITHW